MNSSASSEYLLLSRGQWDKASSKADIEAAIDTFYLWYEANIAKGVFKPGSRLTMEAALVIRDGIRTDGPFAEGKDSSSGMSPRPPLRLFGSGQPGAQAWPEKTCGFRLAPLQPPHPSGRSK